jgi:hypothetical protein
LAQPTIGDFSIMTTSLFVGNISFHATDADLRELFQKAGEVKTVRIIFDRSTGRSRGFGVVEMATNVQARLRGQVTPPRIATPALTIVVSVGIPPPRET